MSTTGTPSGSRSGPDAVSTAARVEAEIAARLLDGRLGPGDWIRQDALATELAVSKIPVREALHRLVGDGTLRTEANRGMVVPELNRSDGEEIFALRNGVERALLAAAVGRHTIVDLAEAEHALERTDLTPTAANWAFHAALYRPSGWHRGVRMAHALHATVAGYVLRYVADLGGADHSDREHRALLACCRDGDGAEADRLLDQHLSAAARALSDHLETDDALPH
ncbi:MAG: GntR family transcriptional regulator [Actinomycetota bacterium]